MISRIKNRFYLIIQNMFHNSNMGYIEQIWLYWCRTITITIAISFIAGLILGLLL